MRTATRASWTNWGRNQSCSPVEVRRPGTEDELVHTVKEAAESDLRVKVVGAGHSFTPIACTDGLMLDLSNYGRVLAHDAGEATATVEAGIPLWRLCDELDARGLAL